MSLRIFAISLLAGLSVFAQGYLSGTALNKKIVTDFYRIVFEPRNPDLVDQYVAQIEIAVINALVPEPRPGRTFGVLSPQK